MSCSNCIHHGMREMISKPYGYVGDIPCLRCSRFNTNDEFVPMNGVTIDATLRLTGLTEGK